MNMSVIRNCFAVQKWNGDYGRWIPVSLDATVSTARSYAAHVTKMQGVITRVVRSEDEHKEFPDEIARFEPETERVDEGTDGAPLVR